jgi:Ca2+-binding RTX toxin-like protein
VTRALVRALVLAGAVAALAGGALTAANAVPTTRLDAYAADVNANALKPAACAALNLQTVQIGGGGSGGSALILGTPGNDNLTGGSGSDCIVGGPGNDTLRGNSGQDVCLGGPGVDSFHQSCEVQIQ